MTNTQAPQDDPALRPETAEERASASLGEITILEKIGGPFSKRISLVNGKPKGDSSNCWMTRGTARRAVIPDIHALNALINSLELYKGLALGRLRDDLGAFADIVTSADLDRKRASDPTIIARTKDYFVYKEGQPGICLIDTDYKGMPEAVHQRIKEAGDVWAVLCGVVPALKNVAHVIRPSTSSGLRNAATGEIFEGSGGLHIFIPVLNATDIPRFLYALHDRLWLAGFGWGWISDGAAFCERALIDRSVGGPERPIFEGAPVIEPPLVQDARLAVAHDGGVLDTQVAIPPLTDAEVTGKEGRVATERIRLERPLKEARAKVNERRFKKLTNEGKTDAEARELIDRWYDRRELTGSFELPFDDPALFGHTVEQVLADPDKYVGHHMADPIEGRSEGRNKAILYQRDDGTLFIKSFAHGGLTYELKTSRTLERDTEIEIILKMPAGDRDQAIKLAAKKLGMTVGALRKEIAKEERKRKKRAPHGPQPHGPQGPAGAIIPPGFKLNKDGLWYEQPQRSGDPPETIWVCASFRILARTRDNDHQNHGLLIEWEDTDNRTHQRALALRLVHMEGNEIAAFLHDAGLSVGTSRQAHEALKTFFGAVKVTRPMYCVARAGWHGNVFMLPNGRTFGETPGGLILQTERITTAGSFAACGSIEEWRGNIANYAVGNHLLVLAMSASFAAPLIDMLNEPSGGIHFYGMIQTGKTTLLRCAKSTFGPGDNAHMNTWRATSNGLEAVAAEYCDLPLMLDEIVQAPVRDLDQIVYMLGNSAGKMRATRHGTARESFFWRLLFLSTGEMPLEARLAEVGLQLRAGQDVRLVSLKADAGAKHGVFQNLHDKSSSAELAEHLRAAAAKFYGTAGSAYLDYLSRERAADVAALKEEMLKVREAFLSKHVPNGAANQIRSIAARFALIAIGGECATVFGITGWPEGEATRAAGALFKSWLTDRGSAAAAEDIQGIERVQAFIGAHGAERFGRITGTRVNGPGGVPEDGPDLVIEERTIKRAGWVRGTINGKEFMILPEVFRREICAGLSVSRVGELLMEKGVLLGATKRHKADLVRIPGYTNSIRLYRISSAILGIETVDGGDGKDDQSDGDDRKDDQFADDQSGQRGQW